MRSAPGSRRISRSPTRSGSAPVRASRAWRASSGRTCAATAAEPQCTITCSGRSAVSAPGSRRTSGVDDGRHRPGVTSVVPRGTSSTGTPRRLTATLATALTSSRSAPSDWSPRTTARRPSGPISTGSPVRSVPAGRVPVTTVPAPPMVNDRSTHRRTSAAGSAAGSADPSAASSERSSPRPSPVTAETHTAGTSASGVPARASRASARASSGSIRSLRVITRTPCRTPSAASAARWSADWGIQPSSAATTNIAAGTGPTPASMLGRNRRWPGTSTKATVRPSSSVVEA